MVVSGQSEEEILDETERQLTNELSEDVKPNENDTEESKTETVEENVVETKEESKVEINNELAVEVDEPIKEEPVVQTKEEPKIESKNEPVEESKKEPAVEPILELEIKEESFVTNDQTKVEQEKAKTPEPKEPCNPQIESNAAEVKTNEASFDINASGSVQIQNTPAQLPPVNTFKTSPPKSTMFQGVSSSIARPGVRSGGNQTEASKIKETILHWCQEKTQGYPNIQISNFSSSWASGMAFCALIHHFCPETFDFSKLDPKNRRGNFDLAFKVAEDKCDISPLLEAEDMVMMGNKPDSRCVFTYLSTMYQKLELLPQAKAAAQVKKNEA